ncbi:MAG: tyrosine--tRNA ligase [Deltaproteobacteria bacterium]|nr:tyrosine--tRNA ligase [Deltaproteobacteria bacterium]MCX7952475.1 tyrosine--tRNA ligase [Deltaproteobacteria bacterium]
MQNGIIDELSWRGLIHDSTNIDELRNFLSESRPVYSGFDPTAPSLQLGNLVALMTLVRFCKFGHKVIILIGGGTGLIGDPSGKTSERQLLSESAVNDNVKAITHQIKMIYSNLGLTADQYLILNNAEWLKKLDVITFLRDIGKHFSVNSMLNREAVRLRLSREGQGISFTEFSYVILQAYDFWYLMEKFDCRVQIGGSDQWGNITAGVELIRRLTGKQAYGLTHPLVVDSSGNKLGKTAEFTVWLDGQKTSPFRFYQYLINTSDKDVLTLLKYLTLLDRNEIELLENALKTQPEKRLPQKRLAEELTKTVHGSQGLSQAQKITEALFANDFTRLSEAEFKNAIEDMQTVKVHPEKDSKSLKLDVVAALVDAGLCSSKSNARDTIKAGGIRINGQVVNQFEMMIDTSHLLFGKYLILSKGARNRSVLEVLI